MDYTKRPQWLVNELYADKTEYTRYRRSRTYTPSTLAMPTRELVRVQRVEAEVPEETENAQPERYVNPYAPDARINYKPRTSTRNLAEYAASFTPKYVPQPYQELTGLAENDMPFPPAMAWGTPFQQQVSVNEPFAAPPETPEEE